MSHLTLPIIWLRERTGEVVMMIRVALDVLAQYSSGHFLPVETGQEEGQDDAPLHAARCPHSLLVCIFRYDTT